MSAPVGSICALSCADVGVRFCAARSLTLGLPGGSGEKTSTVSAAVSATYSVPRRRVERQTAARGFAARAASRRWISDPPAVNDASVATLSAMTSPLELLTASASVCSGSSAGRV